jgi:deoxyribonuclease-1
VRVCQVEAGDAACADGVDNDQDGAIDCDDLDCGALVACAPPARTEDSDALCRDGMDNDGDGFIDCQDFDCSRGESVTVCPVEATDALCADGVDNDGDGFVDCQDHGCSRNDAVTVCGVTNREDSPARCQDGMDNDGDGVFDCEEVSCQALYVGSLCGPDPYSAFVGLRGAPLRAALLGVLEGHTVRSYSNAREFMYGVQDVIDVEGGDIECVYTGQRAQPDGTRTPGGFNTEHSWPRSLGADQSPAVSDIFHLFPSTAASNQARSNFPFGETACLSQGSCLWSQSGSALGTDGNGRVVFQVREARRGDIARALFYFSVRYGLPLDALQEATLRRWHAQDSPDAWERARNRRIEDVQSRLNPFVLHPELVEAIDDF